MKPTLLRLSGRNCASAPRYGNSANSGRSTTMARLMVAGLILAAVATAQAVTVNTSNQTDITAFQSGAFVEGFDSGLTGLAITSYTSVAVLAGNQFSSRNILDPNTPSFN